MNRKGEKIGWIGGWFGGFIWLGLLSVVWIVQNKILNATLGTLLFTVAIIFIFTFAPWKHPNTKCWKLMLPIYLLFFISIATCILLYGGVKSLGLNWTSFLWIIPSLLPFVVTGNRKWNGNA